MAVNIFKIECLTNMHAGSGDVNYNIIDNEVERDPVLQTPTINSSGVKGALREYFRNERLEKFDINNVFGDDGKDGNEKNDTDKKRTSTGKYKFFGATLLARPLRVSDGEVSYAVVTTKELIDNYCAFCNALGVNNDDVKLPSVTSGQFAAAKIISSIEGKTTLGEQENDFLRNLLGENWAITDAKTLNSFDLPVVARNQLKDGESKNLWYEEVVPHKSVFFFAVLTPGDEKFDEIVGEVIQFGGNASIGCGFTKIERLV